MSTLLNNIPNGPLIPGDSLNSSFQAASIFSTDTVVLQGFATVDLPTVAADGTMVLNTTTGKINFYYSGAWRAVTSAP